MVSMRSLRRALVMIWIAFSPVQNMTIGRAIMMALLGMPMVIFA